MLTFPDGLNKSVEILGDMLCNSTYDHQHLELEKDTIWQELEATN
jgi:predicted Zn-dependent peptidase